MQNQDFNEVMRLLHAVTANVKIFGLTSQQGYEIKNYLKELEMTINDQIKKHLGD